MRTKIIIRISTLVLFAIGAIFAFFSIYGGSTNQEPVPELLPKDTLIVMMNRTNPYISHYDLNDMELLHIHKTGQVYLVDPNTLRDTSLYQANLPSYPHDLYVWRIPLTEEASAGGNIDSITVDAASGSGLGDAFPRADCPLAGIGQYNNGYETVSLVYYALLSNDKVTYVDPTLKGTFMGNKAEYELIDMTRNYPEVSLMMQKYDHVCVDSIPTNLLSKTDPYSSNSRNIVEYLAMGRGTNNQIVLIEKTDSENKNIGRVLFCGTDSKPVYNPSLDAISACFNSTSSVS